MNVVLLSTGYFPDPDIGLPVSEAFIYIGAPDTDPEIVVNQKQVSVLQEDGNTVVVPQPIRTSAGGVPVHNGSPVTVLVDGDYSIKVLSKTLIQKYYIPSVSSVERIIIQPFDTVADMVASTALAVGDTAKTLGYNSVGDGGGNDYSIVAAGTGADDGGKYIDLASHQALGLFIGGTMHFHQFGGVGVGTDSTAALTAAIAAAGVSGALRGSGTYEYSSKITPLTGQRIEADGHAGFFYTGTDAVAAVDLSADWVIVRGFDFRSVAGFTGQAFKFNSCLNNKVEDSLITNILNATGVQFSGPAFYNEANNIRILSFGTALHITGDSPNAPNNNIVNNMDIFGTGGIGLLNDGNQSMFQLNDYINEAECSVAHLQVTGGGALIFNNARHEGTAQPSSGFLDIQDGNVSFNGPGVNIQKAVHHSLKSDLYDTRKKNSNNLMRDPLFVSPFDSGTGLPNNWAVTFGSFASITQSATKPGVAVSGNSLEVVSSAAQSNVSISYTAATHRAWFQGKVVTVNALTNFAAPGTDATIQIGFSGGAETPANQVSQNIVAGEWGVHQASIEVPSDATTLTLTFSVSGNGGTFNLFAPIIDVEDSFQARTHPTQERPWLYNGLYLGDLGLQIINASAAPTTKTYKRGDRVFNRLPSVGQPKSWVCTVGGTPGTWVSEGNL